MVNLNPVAVLIFNDDKEVILGKRSDGKGYCFPGGKTEPGEKQLDAIERELYEETNLKIPKNKIFELGYVSVFDELDGVKQHIKITLYTTHINNAKNKIKETEELYDFVWMTPEKALKTLKLFVPAKISLEYLLRNRSFI